MSYPYIPPHIVNSIAQSSQPQMDSFLDVLLKVKEFFNRSFTDDLDKLMANVDKWMMLRDRIRKLSTDSNAPSQAKNMEEYLYLRSPKYDPSQQQFINEILKGVLTPLADILIQRLVRGTIWQ